VELYARLFDESGITMQSWSIRKEALEMGEQAFRRILLGKRREKVRQEKMPNFMFRKILFVRLTILSFLILFMVKCTDHRRDCGNFSQDYSHIRSQYPNDSLEWITFLDTYLSKHSECVDALLTRGDILLQSNQIKDSKLDFQNALETDTANTYAMYRIGLIYSLGDEYDSSIIFFEKAISQKSYKSVIIDYPNGSVADQKKIKYDVDYTQLAFALGRAYYFKENASNADILKALRYFTQCIQDKFELGDCFLYRGTIYLSSHKAKEACQGFNEAIRNGNISAQEYLTRYCN
jgi:tetratricopeptide (TPR) repeat protein